MSEQPVTVAAQRAAGVAAGDTVTVAQQQAGQPVPYALGPDGQPVQTPVPADFGAAQEAAQSAQLTPEEVAEFRALRQAKKDADAQALKDAEEASARLQPATHFVHLGDGTVVEGSSIATHVDNGNGPVPVAGTFLKPEFVTFPG